MLEKIEKRADLLALSPEEEQILCADIRSFLVEHVSQTGGHLASNLGVVELTVALHKVYDPSKDRILFDVGHQAYVHKILTGRRERFPSLRSFGGLAGFPKPSESPQDAFIAGHASDSVSVALGMARARSLEHEDYHVVAVLGDGALTGGLSYEGLNDAGASKEPLVVVLNDNGMSITPNVGGIARHLSLVRLKPGYFTIKKIYRQFTRCVPGGEKIYGLSHRLKTALRRKLIGVTLFEEMGFYYLGPVDGHDISKLTFLLKEARDMNGPVLLHVTTTKGKGYIPAETMPSSYHGVGKFDPDIGLDPDAGSTGFSHTFGQMMCKLAVADKRLCAITAAMEQGTGLQAFAASFPERFFDVGIAEGHAVCMAAGLAKQGMHPVFAVYSTFLQRAFDMLIHDVALLKLHVVFAVDRAGLVGEDGETHHGVFDIGFLRQIPGMQIYCPASQAELEQMLSRAIYETQGPAAVRYAKGTDRQYTAAVWHDHIHQQSDLSIVTYGPTINDVLSAALRLQEEGIIADVIKLDQICPLQLDSIIRSVSFAGRLLIVEEAAEMGCVGQEILAELAKKRITLRKTFLLNLKSGLVPHGNLKALRALTGIDANGIYQAAKELCAK